VKDGGRVKKEGLRVGEIGEGLRVWKRGRVKSGERVRMGKELREGNRGMVKGERVRVGKRGRWEWLREGKGGNG
jgi:hypothetical protein